MTQDTTQGKVAHGEHVLLNGSEPALSPTQDTWTTWLWYQTKELLGAGAVIVWLAFLCVGAAFVLSLPWTAIKLLAAHFGSR